MNMYKETEPLQECTSLSGVCVDHLSQNKIDELYRKEQEEAQSFSALLHVPSGNLCILSSKHNRKGVRNRYVKIKRSGAIIVGSTENNTIFPETFLAYEEEISEVIVKEGVWEYA